MKYFDEIFDPFYKFDFCMNIVFNKKKKEMFGKQSLDRTIYKYK